MATYHSLVLCDPIETSEEVKVAAGFLGGFSGQTREAYTLRLRQFVSWCERLHLALLEVGRTHIELYARELEDLGRLPATSGRRHDGRRLYLYAAAEEGIMEHSPPLDTLVWLKPIRWENWDRLILGRRVELRRSRR
ncbi:MAG: hypothetical protein M3P34_00500 [Actinomycetota bacterium]|nr:hypothetical protein [Actinomycetota bacterium]